MAMLRYTEDAIAETELRFGVRLSNTERWATEIIGSQYAEVICKYELHKLGIMTEAKAHKLRNKLNKLNQDTKEYYDTDRELKYLEREIKTIEENLKK